MQTVWTIRRRLVSIISLMALLVGGAGFLGIQSTRQSFHHSEMLMRDHVEPSILLSQIRLLQADSRSQLLLSLQHDPAGPWVSMHDHELQMHLKIVSDNARQVSEELKKLESVLAQNDDMKQVELAKVFAETREKYLKQGIEPVVDQLQKGDYTEANRVLLKQLNPAFKATAEAGRALEQHFLAAAKEEQATLKGEFDRDMKLMMGGVALGLIVAILAGFFLMRAISVPLDRLIARLQRIASGDLSERIEPRGDLEILQVEKALVATQLQLDQLIGQILATSLTLSDKTRVLDQAMETVTQNASQQHDRVMEVSAAMEELAASVNEVASNIDCTAHAAEGASELVHRGHRQLAESVQAIGEVTVAMSESGGRMNTLQHSIEAVSSITGVIREVADQTNLLALNAAIEAARAGEQGRGFAVVADEVRKLAERTTASTVEIARMVQEIQQAAVVSVATIDQAQHKVEGVTHSTQASGESLDLILKAAEEVSAQTQTIAAASTEQAQATQGVAQSMEQISHLIDSSHEQVARANRVADELGVAASDLENLVSRFRRAT